MSPFASRFIATLLLFGAAEALRTPTLPKMPATANMTNSSLSTRANTTMTTKAEVVQLRAKLERLASSMSGLLAPSSPTAQSAIAGSLGSFMKELKKTLQETGNATDSVAALKRLRDAEAGVHSLVKQMTVRQMQLMKDGEDQEQSLLLGVLMTRQKDPMDRQMEVLMSKEFKDLPVVAAVLAAKDTQTPLFQQVAAYLDKHPSKAVSPVEGDSLEIPSRLRRGKDGKPDVSPIVMALETRVRKLEANQKRHAKLHAEEMTRLEAEAKKDEKTSEKLARRIRSMAKAERRKYLKEALLEKDDISSMQSAVEAVKKGDVGALKRAMDALKAMMKKMQATNGGFLVLIQIAHQLEGRDCPYCAAQCVDKCHEAGKSYVTCLSDCADAGK